MERSWNIMKSTTKNTVRILVLAALAAWPGFELIKLKEAEKQLAASEELRASVDAKLEQTRVKYAEAE